MNMIDPNIPALAKNRAATEILKMELLKSFKGMTGFFCFAVRQIRDDKGKGYHTQWQIYIKYPTPVEIVGDKSTQRRANNTGQTKGCTHQTLVFASFGRRKYIPNKSK